MKYALQGHPEDKKGSNASKESVIDVCYRWREQIESKPKGRNTERKRWPKSEEQENEVQRTSPVLIHCDL